ncbi:MAG TPA: hypothetical protein VEP90_15455 [Methylomirabilota bacterium]|nr:hypothetical protein [Methylomirabilota bacterium]
MLIESLIEGVGIGIILGIIEGLFEAYNRKRWFWTGLTLFVGVTFAIQPLPPYQSPSDFSFMISGIPTWFIAKYRTVKEYQKKQC